MPTSTPRLGIQKPLGTDLVTRASFNTNWDIIDASVPTLQELRDTQTNLLVNPGFEVWTSGPGPFTTSTQPTADGWILVLNGLSTGTVTRESSAVQLRDDSQYGLKIVYDQSGSDSMLIQTLSEALVYALRGRTVTFALWVKANAGSAVRLAYQIDGGGIQKAQTFHAGNDQYEQLSITFTIPTSTTTVSLIVSLEADVTAYLDDGTFAIADAPIAYVPAHPALEHAKIAYHLTGDVGRPGAAVNYLINGGFEVWERGNGPFTTTGYCADLWYLSPQGGGSFSVQRDTTVVDAQSFSSLRATYVHSSSNSYIMQRLTNLRGIESVKGRIVTFSARVRASAAGVVRLSPVGQQLTALFSQSNSLVNQWETLQISFLVPDNESQLDLRFEFLGSATVRIDNATLSVGNFAGFIAQRFEEDLRSCWPYYQRIPLGNTGGTATHAVSGYATAAGMQVFLNIPLYAPLVAAPTSVQVSGGWARTNIKASPITVQYSHNMATIIAETEGAGNYQFYGVAATVLTLEVDQFV